MAPGFPSHPSRLPGPEGVLEGNPEAAEGMGVGHDLACLGHDPSAEANAKEGEEYEHA